MSETPDETIPASIAAHFKKSNFFRVVHADGAYGGATPRGYFHMALYNERGAIPRQVEIPLIDGQPAPERTTDTLGGIVREVEVDVVMDLMATISLYVWLGQKADELRRASGMSDEDWANLTVGLPK